MRSSHRAPGALLLAATLVAACVQAPSVVPASASAGPTTGTSSASALPSAVPSSAPSPTEDTASAAVYARIRAEIVAIRGLEQTADIGPVTIDEEQLKENLEAEIDAEQSAEEFATAEDFLGTLGLIPQGSSLRELTLDLLAGQVAGYYSPDRDELFVVSRTGETVGPVERVTYAHEFTHQLQDQNYDLGSFDTESVDQSDRALAQLSLIEGDASWAQTVWIQQNLTPDDLGELLKASLDPDALAALQDAPAYLRETALFPYQQGLVLVQRLIAQGGYDAVDDAYDAPPRSTEQVLHPDKYLEREAPIEVRIPSAIAGRVGTGWSEGGRDTFGELLLRIWLSEHGVGDQAATEATVGWGGDRLVLLRGPGGAVAVAMFTTWDTASDAAEFAAAAGTALGDPGVEGRLAHAVGSRDVLIAVGDDAAAVLAALRG